MRLALTFLLVFGCLFAGGPRLDVGWSEEFALPADWGAPVRVKDGVASFEARSGASRWVHTTEPVWLGEYPRLQMRYRAARMPRQGTLVSLRPGSVGPVTPGAANPENPFAKGMPVSAVEASQLQADGAWHVLEEDLSARLVNPRCDQIVIALEEGASLELDYLRFVARCGAEAAPVPAKALTTARCAPAGRFRALDLGGSANTTARAALEQLGVQAHPWLKPEVWFAGLPFQTGPACATTLRGREVLTVPLKAGASEIYLLVATRLAGAEFDPKRGAGDVERLVAELEYEDGTVDQIFPYDVGAATHRIADRAVAAWLVPARLGTAIRELRLRDRAANFLVALLGATLNTGRPLFSRVAWGPLRALHSPPQAVRPQPAPVSASVRGGIVALDNRYYHCEFDARAGLKPVRLDHKLAGPLLAGSAEPLVDLGTSLTLSEWKAEGRAAAVTYSAGPLMMRVRLEVDDSPELALSLELNNAGGRVVEVPLRFPNLGPLAVAGALQTHYLFPRAAAVFGWEPGELEEDYSSAFPMQFMDLYNPRQGAGIYLLVKDLDLAPKRFRLVKTSVGAAMSVSYSYRVRGSAEWQHLRLEPGESFRSAAVAAGFHAGGWRAAFDAYRAWVRAWYRPASPRKAWFEAIYNCRRDYPLRGSGVLFDVRGNHYTFERLIEEGVREFGGIDLVDISGWAYSEQYGRVGEYTRYELGGLEDFRRGIAAARKWDVPTGLYLEGYLIDARSQIGRTRARQWQIRARNQEPLAWSGAPTELFMCPRVAEWQDWMARTYAAAAAQTGAQAFYIDEFGFSRPDRACYNPAHAHPPGATVAWGEREMMKKIRAALDRVDRDTAIYIEEMPPDANARYADGAFCYAINRADERRSPGAINLYRFVFPDFKLFDMVSEGIDARAMTTADMKKSFFHGNGLWLKGHARSWYAPDVREFIRRAHAVLRAHSGAFQSQDADPLVATLNPAVLANRFSGESETVYTLYNESYRTVRGPVLGVPDGLRGRSWVELFSGRSLQVCAGGAALCLEMGPREVAAVAVQEGSHRQR